MTFALVTGGTRRIGAHIAARLARAGYGLALHYHHRPTMDPLLERALAETGVACRLYQADLADGDAVARMTAAVATDFGSTPSLLVNNASLFGADDLTTATMTSLLTHYAINCAAPTLLAQWLAADAGPGREAVIVNILDQKLAQPHGDNLSYTLGKYALMGLTRLLAHSLAPHVRVHGVAPGLTLPTPDYAPEQMAALADDMPLGILPDPAEIADAVFYLARARSATGQILYIDGGAHLQSYARDFVHMDVSEGSAQ